MGVTVYYHSDDVLCAGPQITVDSVRADNFSNTSITVGHPILNGSGKPAGILAPSNSVRGMDVDLSTYSFTADFYITIGVPGEGNIPLQYNLVWYPKP